MHWLPIDIFLNFGIPKPSKIFAGTRFDLPNINFKYNDSDIVFTHFKDYDTYLHLKQVGQNKQEKFIVYVDQYFPFHPELKELKIDANQFYFSLRDFLKELSNVTGHKVVVCVHPTTDMNRINNFFDEFEIYSKRTIEILSQAEFGVFFSSSVILACLFLKKPILLIKSDRILPPQINHFNKLYEEILGMNSIDIDMKCNKDELMNLIYHQDHMLTELFERYVKHPGTREDLEHKIIAECINEYVTSRN